MLQYTTYVCETCGFESKDRDVVELCEARHLGLTTLEEKHTHDALKSAARYYASLLLENKNEKTEAAHDKAIKDLLEFETIHGLI